MNFLGLVLLGMLGTPEGGCISHLPDLRKLEKISPDRLLSVPLLHFGNEREEEKSREGWRKRGRDKERKNERERERKTPRE